MSIATPLDGAVLGLLLRDPMSGYEIRRVFASTPLGGYSDSPGSIYPALKRLVRGRLVSGRRQAGTRRGAVEFRATKAGRAEFATWVSAPPEPAEVERSPHIVLLRFAFADGVMTTAQIVEWLATLEGNLTRQIERVVSFRRNDTSEYEPCALLALDAGIATSRALLSWSRAAQSQIVNR